jgi:hypothetical protein
MKRVKSLGARLRAENKGEGRERRTPASEPQRNLTNLTNLRKPTGAQLADFRLSAEPLMLYRGIPAFRKTGA